MTKFVYTFSEGNKDMKNLLGGKGANLAEMTAIGLPVPQGFTITTEACNKYYDENEVLSAEIKKQVFDCLRTLEEITGKKIGDYNNPLLVSVRSGARASMPGMMDTVLNLGLNDEVTKGFAEATNNPRFAYDSYRRFIQMFADVVKGYSKSSFERVLNNMKKERGVNDDTELNADDMYEITMKFKNMYKELSGTDFPQDPNEQLIEAITAVFRSWNNERAIVYRRMNGIPSLWGTAVNVQEMVYGNRGNDSATGVAFTRNPATGENHLYGEFMVNAQGEDLVSGIRTPKPISELKQLMPDIYNEFKEVASKLEKHYRDMQDMEFTIEKGRLYMLQTRNGKRTAHAALKIAVDMEKTGMISKEEALLRVGPEQLDQLLHPTFDPNALKSSKVIATGLAASPGAVTGKIYFTADDVGVVTKNGEDAILARLETSPEDIEGMKDAKGVLTVRGGMTSHAAVVARGMGRSCVAGCGDLVIDEENKTMTTKDGIVYKEGDYISLDGSTGRVYAGKIETIEPKISGDFEILMKWADSARTLKIRTNSDTPNDAKQALKFGAEGIGLCRTEHMFFKEDRIFAMREMITAETKEQRDKALDKLLPMQRSDFEEIFKIMSGHPVTIRYLDPPLHEFLPKTEEELEPLASTLGMSIEKLKEQVDSLKEFNPMMGHRGCRLAITYPEIAVMQTKAVIEAAINVKEEGYEVIPEIMIPLVGDINELKYVKDIIVRTTKEILDDRNAQLKYHIGTMIEIPRAALISDQIAQEAEFFSFGTNDLTQLTYGFSRDDASKFLTDYYDKHIFENDPFKKLDQVGVGSLVEMSAVVGRKIRPNLELGICGEHGGEPTSIEFCHRIGLDYVSCSPFRVPTARLAAAQAKVREQLNN